MSNENTSFLTIPLKYNATIIKGVKKMFSKYTRGTKNQCWIETSFNVVVNITVLFRPTIPSKLLKKMNVALNFKFLSILLLGKYKLNSILIYIND